MPAVMSLATGKFAVVKIGSVSYTFEEWSLSDQADDIEGDSFGQSADVDGNIRHYKEPGMVTTTVSLKGPWNKLQATKQSAFRTGAAITGLFLGVTATLGFTVSGYVKSSPVNTNVKTRADASVEIHVNEITAAVFA